MNRKIVLLSIMVAVILSLLAAGCGSSHEGTDNISRNYGDSLGPRLAVDSTDGLHLVWFDISTGNNEIIYASKAADGGWSEAVNVSHNSSHSRSPSLDVDSQGDVHMAWHDFAPGNYDIFYASKPKGGTWSEPFNVTNNNEASSSPSLAVDSRGTVHLAWHQETTGNTDIYCASKSQDGVWSEAVNISHNSGDSYNAFITVDSRDNIHVVWYDGTPGNDDIFYATKSSGGEWSEPTNISNNEGGSEYPVLAVDSQDMLYLAWHDTTPGNWEIFYSFKPLGGTWSAPLNISRNFSNSGFPALSLDKEGNLHLVWNDDSPGNYDIFYTSKPNGGSWGKVVNISKTSEKSGDPSVAVDSQNRVHIAWSEYVAGNWDIVYTYR